MKCTNCGFNYKRDQMSLEAYNRMKERRKTIRLPDMKRHVQRLCDSCYKKGARF